MLFPFTVFVVTSNQIFGENLMNAPAEFKLPATIAGYKTFTLGEFTLARDEYFVTLTWPE
jgi:hypothetical protein